MELMIRPFQPEDVTATADLWHRSGLATYTYLPTWQSLSAEVAQQVFRDVIMANCQLWVGVQDERIVAFLAMNGSYIDRLYVDPSAWRQGWGTRLLEFAKTLSPNGLELHTHTANTAARALYEKHGFRAVAFGISPPPESAPDVEYHWRPA